MSVLGTLDRLRHRGADGGDDDDLAPIDPRIEARRLAVHGERRQRFRRRLLAVAITVTVIAAVFGATRSALLDVDAVQVAGAVQTSPTDVRNAAGIRIGDHLTDLDLDGAATRVRALPWVHDVRIERSWKGTIDLTVTERTPVAALAGPDPAAWLLVDVDRRVLGPLTTPPTELPVIQGVAGVAPGDQVDPKAAGALAVAHALTPGLRSRVAAITVVDAAGIDLAVRPAGVVHLGTTDELAQKIQSMQTVFGQVDLHCLSSVDLRVADAPVLTRDRSCA